MRRRVLCVAICVLAVVLPALAETGELTVWSLPYEHAFPGGIALDDGFLYVAANGGREVFRLDPSQNVFRSWGVAEEPQDVVVAEGVPFCTGRANDQIVYFNPEGLSVSTTLVPFSGIDLGEIHRGPDTVDGHQVFWVVERMVRGILRYEYDPAFAPVASGTPHDAESVPVVTAVDAEVVVAEHEVFSYNVDMIPDPEPLHVASSSPPFTEWRLPLDDEHWVTDLAVAEDGALWISAGLPFLFRFDPEAGTLQMLETIQDVYIFQGLLPAPDGSIWFGNIVDGSIGHFNPETGLSEVWRIPGVVEIYDLAFDAEDGIWFTDRVGAAIGYLEPSADSAVLYPLSEDSEPLYLAVDDAGVVWFSMGSGNYLGRLRTLA